MPDAGLESFKHEDTVTLFEVLSGIPLLVELSQELSQLHKKSDIQNFTKSTAF